jgi:hypothetical protein
MSADCRGHIIIEVDFDAPFTDPSTELVRLAACAIEAIAMQPDIDDVRGLDHQLVALPLSESGDSASAAPLHGEGQP